MSRDLWAIVFPDEEADESTLADLYDIALARAPDALREYVATHLRIGDAPLPASFRAWFSAPAAEGALDVIHLNGIAGDIAKQVTFSTMQYAPRLARRDKAYERLVADLGSHAFVFVGTKLDETVLWQHVELDGTEPDDRPHSFIVTPSLSRQILLEQHHIHWVQATAAEIAELL